MQKTIITIFKRITTCLLCSLFTTWLLYGLSKDLILANGTPIVLINNSQLTQINHEITIHDQKSWVLELLIPLIKEQLEEKSKSSNKKRSTPSSSSYRSAQRKKTSNSTGTSASGRRKKKL